MRISDWSSDVCSSDLIRLEQVRKGGVERAAERVAVIGGVDTICGDHRFHHGGMHGGGIIGKETGRGHEPPLEAVSIGWKRCRSFMRSEEHTSELQSLMRISYAVFCLKKKTKSDKYY